MKRRDLFFASGAIFAGMRSRAQTRPAGTPFRIGLILSGTEPTLSWLRAAMSATGWQEGREYIFVSTGAGYDATVADARRLVAEKVDLVWVNSTSHALALRQVTLDLPIVMWASGYPVEAGLAVSLARPGKNVTGITSYAGTGIWASCSNFYATRGQESPKSLSLGATSLRPSRGRKSSPAIVSSIRRPSR